MRNRIFKKTTLVWSFIVFLFSLVFSYQQMLANDHSVIILKSQDISAYNEVIRGFEEASKAAEISIREIYNLKGDIQEGKKVVRKLKKMHRKPDLILSVGILATVLAKEEFIDVPILFCMVVNHERFDLKRVNIVGISAEAAVADQFAVMNQLIGPNKTVGVIYDPKNTKNFVTEAKGVAEKFGMKLIKKEVEYSDDVIPSLNDIIGRIDALWIVPDMTIISKDILQNIFHITQEHRLPTFCTSKAFIKSGALLAISPDYASIGLQASRLVLKLLTDPNSFDFWVKQPNNVKLILNTKTAKKIDINISALKDHSNIILYP